MFDRIRKGLQLSYTASLLVNNNHLSPLSLTNYRTIKSFFSNKGLNTNNMMLVEDNEIVREEEIIANIMIISQTLPPT